MGVEGVADFVMILATGGNKAVGVRVGGVPLEGLYQGPHVIPQVVRMPHARVRAAIPVQMGEACQGRPVVQRVALAPQSCVVIHARVVAPFQGLPAHAPKEHPIIIHVPVEAHFLGRPAR